LLNHALETTRVEGNRRLRVEDQPIDHLKDDVLHAGELELLNCHLHGILDPHSHVQLVCIVVLHAYHKVEFQLVGLLPIFVD
jgi:nitrate reductase gamma subunit